MREGRSQIIPIHFATSKQKAATICCANEKLTAILPRVKRGDASIRQTFFSTLSSTLAKPAPIKERRQRRLGCDLGHPVPAQA
jgi:hypothetical protein